MIQQKEIILPALSRGFHIITSQIENELKDLPESGLLNIFIKHTSAGLTINENADPSVIDDFESFMKRLVPEDTSLFSHTMEGSDDMPAHIKSSVFGVSLNIPISQHRLNLGTWQGIYICEFRNSRHRRKLVLTIYS
jgi:secondary thiamine-phosphate synthase enzyme